MKFNEEQQLAIDITGCNVLVSAGAGSGKTAVLTERVVNIISNPDNDTNIDNLLILTFTNNAAAEMRKRITDRLKEMRDELLIHKDETKKLQKIREQINLIKKANITTFDAFANSVVKQYFYKADVDPGIRIAGGDDSSELTKISATVLDELFEKKYEENNKEFLTLVDYFCPTDNDDSNLRKALLSILHKTSSLPFPDKWLENCSTLYDSSLDKKTALFSLTLERLEYVKHKVMPEYERAIAHIHAIKNKYLDYYETDDRVIKLCENCFGAIGDVFENIHQNVMNSKSFDDAAVHTQSIEIPELRITSKGAPDEVADFYNITVKKVYKKNTNDMYIKPLKASFSNFDADIEIINRQKEILDYLLTLYAEFNRAYTLKKNELMVASYADISHYCLKILVNDDGTPTNEANTLGEKFKEIIIDEYQDNNPLQEEILKALSGERKNLFMVGDVKQSIYRFRYASPEIFTHKYNSYSKDDYTKDNVCVCLNQNYRSRQNVIDFVNFVFYQAMIKELGGITYDQYSALKAAADYGQIPDDLANRICNQNELIIYNSDNVGKGENYDDATSSQNDNKNDVGELSEAENEAHIAAKKITELINPENPFYIYDKSGKYRPCTLSDIAIIMNHPNKFLVKYESILGSYGIPVIIESKANIFNTIEIKTVIALLKVIDNPHRDAPLITVLHSPMFSVTCNELVKIKLEPLKADLVERHESLYARMLEYIDMPEADRNLVEKLKKFVALREKVTLMLRAMPVSYMLARLYRMTGYINYVSIIQNGDIRVKNLKILLKKVEELSNSGITDFTSIVEKLSEMETNGETIIDDSAKADFDAVNIMSIHKSKGLEYPIVIVTQLGHTLTTYDMDRPLKINTDYGIAFKDFNESKRETQESRQMEAFKELYKRDSVSENLRLLYVAMTRAREKLIMIGGSDINKNPEFFEETMDFYEDNQPSLTLSFDKIYNAKSFLELIMNTYKNGKCYYNSTNGDFIDIDSLLKITAIKDNIEIEDLGDISYIKNLLDEAEQKESLQKKALDKKLKPIPLDESVILPSKLSISEIKRQHMVEQYNQLESELFASGAPAAEAVWEQLSQNKERDTSIKLDMPDFYYDNSDTLTSTQYGTAYHTAFERVDFTKNTIEAIEVQLLKLKETGVLKESEYKAIKPQKILAFLNSPLGRRAAAAKNVRKETPFVMRLSPNEVYRNNKYTDSSAGILVHGIIDLFFEEDDRIVLVDYKTDKVDSKNTKEKIAERYQIQLDFYKMAIDRGYAMYHDSLTSKKRVVEMYLYLLNVDECVPVKDFDE